MWGWLAGHIAGGVVRWIVAIIIGAVCLMFGFAPEHWIATAFDTPPQWLVHPLARLAIIAIGVVAVGAVLLIRGRKPSKVVICNRIDIRHIGEDRYIRVRLENSGDTDIYGATAYLDSVEGNDPGQQIAQLDLPTPLYTQERLRERRNGLNNDPARPFMLRASQEKWLEVFQSSEIQLHFWFAHGRGDIISVSGLILYCRVHAGGETIRFSVQFEELGPSDHIRVRLLDQNGNVVAEQTDLPSDE